VLYHTGFENMQQMINGLNLNGFFFTFLGFKVFNFSFPKMPFHPIPIVFCFY